MSQLLLLNPRRRRRKAKSSHRRRSRRARRPMTAKQLKYFGPRRMKRRGRRRSAVVLANPRRLRRPRRARRSSGVRRRFRRNPIGTPQIRASVGSIQRVAMNAAVGATGAIAVDVLMGQAARFLPPTVAAAYNAQGGVNLAYYGIKASLAIAMGIAGAALLPGKLKALAARAAEGSLTVQGYQILRAVIPAEILTMGYYNPGRVVAGPNGLSRVRGMRAYLTRQSALAGGRGNAAIGGSVRNFEGYAL